MLFRANQKSDGLLVEGTYLRGKIGEIGDYIIPKTKHKEYLRCGYIQTDECSLIDTKSLQFMLNGEWININNLAYTTKKLEELELEIEDVKNISDYWANMYHDHD